VLRESAPPPTEDEVLVMVEAARMRETEALEMTDPDLRRPELVRLSWFRDDSVRVVD
jgi:hypothetical protein